MKAIRNEDLWFGIVLIILFGMAGITLFGPILLRIEGWLQLAGVVPAIGAIAFMRPHLDELDRIPRFVGWFSLGVTSAVWMALFDAIELVPIYIVLYGLLLATADLIAERFSSNEEAK